MKSRTLLLALVAFIKASGDLGLFDGVQKSTSLVAAAEVSATEPAVAGESFEFQAEVNRLMDIIINSLYKSKEIFLREVISNASDALDKLRFMAVSDKSALAEGDDELRIRISADKEARTITIADTGVGMTRQELIANLGTVAKSGTTNFVEALGETGDLSLIGQFGVGFYSVYLVADKVQVVSKHAGDKQYIWESTADSTFTVREDPRGDTLGRGTEIVLHLKEDADEFLEETRLADLIHRYSEFITFPIYQQREVSKEVGADDDEEEEEVSLDEEGDEEEEEEEEEEDAAAEEEPKGKTKTVKVKEWQRVNESTAIWARASKDVTDAEYQSFYKAISKDYSDALTWTHFKAEGDVEFKSILFIPSAAAFDHYNKYYESPAGLKLYVRKVLIKDDFEDLLPRYLNFVRGVVDSDALPLNVSRETLQQHKALQVIGKKLVRKTLDVLKKMSEESIKASEEKAKDAEEKKEGEEAADGQELDDKEDKYIKFWDEFGRNIKMGVIEDTANRSKLLKLLRFKTSKSNGKWTSLQEYVSRMKDFQKNIFYVSGENMAAVERSPFAEKLKAKDIEIIYITDPTDEYCVQHATTFEDKKIVAASKEGIKIGDEDDKRVKALDKHYKAEYKPLTEYLKTLYDGKIAKVIVGQHGGTAPCLIVTPQYGYTANMERILKSQTFSDETVTARFSQRSMEINPRHPIVAKLNTLVGDSKDKESAEAEDLAWLLYDTAMAASGFTMEDAGSFSSRMYRVLGQTLKVESLDLLPEAEPDEEEEEAEEEKAADAEPDLDELYAQFQSGQQPVLDEEEEETGTDEL